MTIFRIKVLEENSKKKSKKNRKEKFQKIEKKKKRKEKEFVFSSPGQNIRLLSLPYS